MAKARKTEETRRAATIGVSVTSEDIARLEALTSVLPGTTKHSLAREAMRRGLTSLEEEFPAAMKARR